MKTIPIVMEKSCSGCTACCSGTLSGEAHGRHFWKGRPCHYVTTSGCSIYEQRPENPCKTFECGYLKFDWMPHWMRPDQSGVIFVLRETQKSKTLYIEVSEYIGKMKPEVMSFIFISYVSGAFQNITYQVDGGWNRVGSKEFLIEMSGQTITEEKNGTENQN